MLGAPGIPPPGAPNPCKEPPPPAPFRGGWGQHLSLDAPRAAGTPPVDL